MDYIILIKILIVIAWLVIGEATWRIMYYSPIKFFHKEHNDVANDEACNLTRKIRPIVCCLGLLSLILFFYLLLATKEARPLFFKHGLTLYYKVQDEQLQETKGEDVV